MNQVNITGMIANEPIFREEVGGIPHTVLSLRRRHKTRTGELRKETYRISAWHCAAVWARDNITVGQIVTVHGYLTQRKTRDGAIATEICVEEIVPSIQTMFKPSQTIGNDAASVNSDGAIPAQSNQSVTADIAPVTDTINTADATEPDSRCASEPETGKMPDRTASPGDSDAPET